MFPQLAQFADLSLLLLRLMVAAVFVTSGWSHVKDPKERAKSIGMRHASCDCRILTWLLLLISGHTESTIRVNILR